MSEMHVLDRTGHTTTRWSRSSSEEVDAARATYDALTSQGYRAFRTDANGGQGVRMDAFDPNAESMVMVPHLRGG